MNTYRVKVTVVYDYEAEAESEREANDMGWQYADHPHTAEVYDIEVYCVEEGDDGDEDADEEA